MKTRLSHTALAVFVLLFFASQNVFSQSQITGTITNSKGDGIFYATVALYKLADSTVVMGESTDAAGKFTLKNIPDGAYFMAVNMLGYLDLRLSAVNLPSDNRKDFKLALDDDAKTLATVEVTAKAPLLEQRADRLIVNVENNLTSLNMNLLDVLKKVPGVLVIGEDRKSVV